MEIRNEIFMIDSLWARMVKNFHFLVLTYLRIFTYISLNQLKLAHLYLLLSKAQSHLNLMECVDNSVELYRIGSTLKV